MTEQLETVFHARINGRDEQVFSVATGVYVSAAAAIPALLGVDDYPLEIEIWVPHLLPDYGPYTFFINEAGGSVDMLIQRGGKKLRVRTVCND